MSMSPQTKRAIQKMRNAGFQRREFRVRTKRTYIPSARACGVRNPYQYGDPIVSLTKNDLPTEREKEILRVGLGLRKTILLGGYVLHQVLADEVTAGKMLVTDQTIGVFDQEFTLETLDKLEEVTEHSLLPLVL